MTIKTLSKGILSGTTKSGVGDADPQPVNANASITTRVIFINLSKNSIVIDYLYLVLYLAAMCFEQNNVCSLPMKFNALQSGQSSYSFIFTFSLCGLAAQRLALLAAGETKAQKREPLKAQETAKLTRGPPAVQCTLC